VFNEATHLPLMGNDKELGVMFWGQLLKKSGVVKISMAVRKRQKDPIITFRPATRGATG